MTELLVVEDDPHTRFGLKIFLEDSGWTVHEAGSFEAAMDRVRQGKPDAVVTDIVIPRDVGTQRGVLSESVGLELVAELKSRWPDLGIVIFSAHEDRGEIVLDFLRQGIRGFACLLKGAAVQDLDMAIRQAMRGGVYIDPAITLQRQMTIEALLKGLTPIEQTIIERGQRLLSALTPRETEVASRLAAARSTEQIARDLSLSTGTVQNYVVNIYSKLGLVAEEEGIKVRRDVLLSKLWLVASLEGQLPD
ncbi:MAG: response regulator transcription factor [Anaerolineae bacterium]|jgi:DNA-binding NarL/FixJ family response regulator